ncbi:condensation domain-containing protein [Streptomyces sp. XD-27]|nr:condensation domain-containing protein [Streptomyces sp. XD-27]WKX68650.1 condensation domain-containing protein [Streptomyces sp. XD-27]
MTSLSSVRRGAWFAERRADATTVQADMLVLRLKGELDTDALASAVREVAGAAEDGDDAGLVRRGADDHVVSLPVRREGDDAGRSASLVRDLEAAYAARRRGGPPAREPDASRGDHDTVEFGLDDELLSAVEALALQWGTTAPGVLEAAFAVLLRRLGGGDGLAVGLPVAGPAGATGAGGESAPPGQGAVGRVWLFTDASAVPADLWHDDPSFAALLRRMRERDAGSYGAERLPFALHRPLDGHSGGRTTGVLQYSDAVCDRPTAQSLAERFVRVVRQVVAEPDRRLEAVGVSLVPTGPREMEAWERRYPGLVEVWPLTPLQSGLVFHSLVGDSARDAYRMQIVLDLQGPVDGERMRTAGQALLDRYANLRVACVAGADGDLLQVVVAGVELPWHAVDLTHLEAEPTASEAFDALRSEEFGKPFDTGAPPCCAWPWPGPRKSGTR